jgi:hypothetical protein
MSGSTSRGSSGTPRTTQQARASDGPEHTHLAEGREREDPSLSSGAPVLESRAPTVREDGSKTPPAGERQGGEPPPAPSPDEFAAIPSRPARHPVIAAAAVFLAAFLVFQIRDDVRYALSSATAVDLGDARALVSTGAVPANRYVRLSGRADRESALLLDTQGSWNVTQFFRLLGTDDRVFVRRVPDPLPLAVAEQDVFTGRLVPFGDLSFEESIRRHFSTQVSATHFFAPATIETALGGQGGSVVLVDRAGQRVTLGPQDELAIDTAHPGDLRIELPAERYPDLARARALVADQGGRVLSAETTVLARQAVVARFPDDRREAALAALSDLDRRVRIGPARTTMRARLADLRLTPQGLVARSRDGAEVTLPRAEIEAVRSVAPVRIPEGAWLLVEGDRPGDHLSKVIIAVLLVGFAFVNLIALRPFLLRRRGQA